MTGFLMLAAVSCGQKDNGTGLVSVKYSQLPQGEDLMLSELVGEPEFIVLDSDTAVAYTPFATVNVSDTYISIFSIASRTPLKLFDRTYLTLTSPFFRLHRVHRLSYLTVLPENT